MYVCMYVSIWFPLLLECFECINAKRIHILIPILINKYKYIYIIRTEVIKYFLLYIICNIRYLALRRDATHPKFSVAFFLVTLGQDHPKVSMYVCMHAGDVFRKIFQYDFV